MPTDLTPIFEALAASPATIAAWEQSRFDAPLLSVFDVSESPRQVAHVVLNRDERSSADEALRTAGYPTGIYPIATGIVWRSRPDTFHVWAARGEGLVADRQALALVDGTVLDRSKLVAVVPFTDDDTVTRMVSLRFVDAEHTIAQHFKHSASFAPSFEDGGTWDDIGWLSALTRDLAEWLQIPIEP